MRETEHRNLLIPVLGTSTEAISTFHLIFVEKIKIGSRNLPLLQGLL